MVNKRGWIRTLEAVIAVLIILGFIVYIYPKGVTYDGIKPQVVEVSQDFIMKNILEDVDLRDCVLRTDCQDDCFCDTKMPADCRGDVISLISSNIPSGYEYKCEVCPRSTSCVTFQEFAEKDVYTSSIYVSSITGETSFGRVMRLYFYEA